MQRMIVMNRGTTHLVEASIQRSPISRIKTLREAGFLAIHVK